MMVGIDQPRNHRAAGGIDCLAGLEILGDRGDNIEDAIVFDEDVMVFKLFDAMMGVPADDGAVFDEELHEQYIFTRQPLTDAKEFVSLDCALTLPRRGPIRLAALLRCIN